MIGHSEDITLSEKEREWLAQQLGADEEVRLMLRPRTELEPGAFTFERVVGCVWLLICLGATVGMMENDARGGLLMLPWWLIGFFAVFRLQLTEWDRRRTLYVISARRVLVREPKWLLFYRTRAYALREGMIQEVGVLPDGYGNIVFDYGRDEYNDGAREERVAKQFGLIDIPQVKYVQAVLEETVKREGCRQ